MVFADLKNDFVFRRIFGTHPDILAGLLNDLLERKGPETIETLEYLPSEQLPLVPGWKVSILDVRCRDRSGTTFVVEMQLLHVPGFMNRVAYNACKAYVDQFRSGDSYTKLTNVVAVSICDFILWPDPPPDAKGLAPVPMLSRWGMTEETSGCKGLPQLQYAFLELPKFRSRRPETGADFWAWLFLHAPEMSEMPADLPRGPYREAAELANEASFSMLELDAYRKVMDEIQQARDYGDEQRAAGEIAGEARGVERGEARGKEVAAREMLLRLLRARFGDLPQTAVDRVQGSDAAWCADILERAITAPDLRGLDLI